MIFGSSKWLPGSHQGLFLMLIRSFRFKTTGERLKIELALVRNLLFEKGIAHHLIFSRNTDDIFLH